MKPPRKKRRGFAVLTKERRTAISIQGGAAVRPEQRSFSVDRALAARAGRKGAATVAAKRRAFALQQDLKRLARRLRAQSRQEVRP